MPAVAVGLLKKRLRYMGWPIPTGLGSARINRYVGISVAPLTVVENVAIVIDTANSTTKAMQIVFLFIVFNIYLFFPLFFRVQNNSVKNYLTPTNSTIVH